jgi:hypothetical protein
MESRAKVRAFTWMNAVQSTLREFGAQYRRGEGFLDAGNVRPQELRTVRAVER